MKKFALSIENPLLILFLVITSAIAVSTTLENSLVMGISVLFIFLFSNIVISLILKFISDKFKLLVHLLIASIFVTIVELVLKEYIYTIYTSFGIYLPLLSLCCLELDRTTSKSEELWPIIKRSLVLGIYFIIVLSLFGTIREILWNNTITVMNKTSSITGYREIIKVFPKNEVFPNSFFATPAIAFILLGIMLGLYNAFRNRGESK